MSRIKRWINMHKKEFNPDGTLKEEAREQMRSIGMTDGAIDSYATRVKAEYDEWKYLDETKPEIETVYTAYDLFTTEEKRRFLPDGSLRPDYIEYAKSIGTSDSALATMERIKKIDVDNFNHMSEVFAARGMNFGEFQMRARYGVTKNYAAQQKQLQQDIRNGEEISSLPFDVDPGDYYQQHGYDPQSDD